MWIEKPKISALNSVYLPAKKKTNSEKLMLVLHGLGDSVEGYRFLPNELQIDELSYLLVNAPDQYFIGYSWFDIENNPGPGIERSRNLLFQVFDELFDQGLDPCNASLFGFSQGALMTLDFAARYPKKLACMLAISGYTYFLDEYPAQLSTVAKEQNIFATHGTHDPVLPIENTRQQIKQLQDLGMNIRWQEYPKDHTILPDTELPDLRNFIISSYESMN